MNVAAWIFVCGVGVVLYVLLGYPALVAIWAHLFPKRISKQFIPTRVSIIIPVRNGAKWIERKIESLLAADYPAELLEIVFVSDGSTDNTEALIRSHEDSRIRLLVVPAGGKATAVRRGIEIATGEIIAFTDVRQEIDPKALHQMIACFADPSVGVVTGQLYIGEGHTSEEHNTGLYWRYEKTIRKNLSQINGLVGASGSIYAMRRELVKPIPRDILLDDVYLPLCAAFQGFRIYFEETAKAYDFPTALRSEFWRKMRTQAGVYQILTRFPRLLWPGHRLSFHFISHKFGRLLLPFVMIAIAISSFGLPAPWRDAMLSAQAVFYALALLDPVIPEGNPLKRLSSLIRTFVVLLAAALSGIAVFFVPAQHLWKETRVAAAPAELEHINSTAER